MADDQREALWAARQSVAARNLEKQDGCVELGEPGAESQKPRPPQRYALGFFKAPAMFAQPDGAYVRWADVAHLFASGVKAAGEPCRYPDCGCPNRAADGMPDCRAAAAALGVTAPPPQTIPAHTPIMKKGGE